jgi:hypothetical protein
VRRKEKKREEKRRKEEEKRKRWKLVIRGTIPIDDKRLKKK